MVGPVQSIPLEGVQALAGNRRRVLLLRKVLGETLPVLPSLADQIMIQCLVLCVVDTAIVVVLSAGEQNMHGLQFFQPLCSTRVNYEVLNSKATKNTFALRT